LKYLRPTTLGYKDLRIRKSEFVANTHSFIVFIAEVRSYPCTNEIAASFNTLSGNKTIYSLGDKIIPSYLV